MTRHDDPADGDNVTAAAAVARSSQPFAVADVGTSRMLDLPRPELLRQLQKEMRQRGQQQGAAPRTRLAQRPGGSSSSSSSRASGSQEGTPPAPLNAGRANAVGPRRRSPRAEQAKAAAAAAAARNAVAAVRARRSAAARRAGLPPPPFRGPATYPPECDADGICPAMPDLQTINIQPVWDALVPLNSIAHSMTVIDTGVDFANNDFKLSGNMDVINSATFNGGLGPAGGGANYDFSQSCGGYPGSVVAGLIAGERGVGVGWGCAG